MPESRDYYRGAIEALEHVENQPVHSNVKLTVLRFRLDEYRRKLAAIPPAEPAPDPRPCPDCAKVCRLVESLRVILDKIDNASCTVGEDFGDFGINVLAKQGLDAIAAARKSKSMGGSNG